MRGCSGDAEASPVPVSLTAGGGRCGSLSAMDAAVEGDSLPAPNASSWTSGSAEVSDRWAEPTSSAPASTTGELHGLARLFRLAASLRLQAQWPEPSPVARAEKLRSGAPLTSAHREAAPAEAAHP